MSDRYPIGDLTERRGHIHGSRDRCLPLPSLAANHGLHDAALMYNGHHSRRQQPKKGITFDTSILQWPRAFACIAWSSKGHCGNHTVPSHFPHPWRKSLHELQKNSPPNSSATELIQDDFDANPVSTVVNSWNENMMAVKFACVTYKLVYELYLCPSGKWSKSVGSCMMPAAGARSLVAYIADEGKFVRLQRNQAVACTEEEKRSKPWASDQIK